jgi:hypothetical protein
MWEMTGKFIEIERLQDMSVEEWAYFKLAALEVKRTGKLSAFAIYSYFQARERGETCTY